MRKDLAILTLVFALVSGAFFLFAQSTRGGMDSVYKAWDGPSYVIAAESLYLPALAVTYNSIQSPEIRADFTFLPAHFPLYPWLIRLFSPLGYYRAMLGLALLFSLSTLYAFYFLVTRLKLNAPLLLTLPLILLPPRWFILSHTGSSEPLFLTLVLLSLLFYFRRQSWASAIFAAGAQLARPQGALLGLTYLSIAAIDLYRSKQLKPILARYYPYLLIPASLLLVFAYYFRQTGNFWAFFDSVAIFHHFAGRLLPSFNFGAENIETFWLEANVIYLFLYLATIIRLLQTRIWQLGIFGLVYYLPLLFLQHTDIARYAIPLFPLAFIAFAQTIATRSFTLATFLSAPAIFLYTTNFILYNRAP